MSIKSAFTKFGDQLTSIKDNAAFSKVDDDSQSKKERKAIKNILVCISSVKNMTDINDIKKFIAKQVAEMKYKNTAYLSDDKGINRLIERVQLHANKFVDLYCKSVDKDAKKEAKKVVKKTKSTSDDSSDYSSDDSSDDSGKDMDELKQLKKDGYFTCSDSSCSCNDVFECEHSESDCSCSDEDNLIDDKKLKRLRKLNRQQRAKNQRSRSCSKSKTRGSPRLTKPSSDEIVFESETESDFSFSSASDSSSCVKFCLTPSNGASRCIPQKNEEVDTFNSLLKNTSNKLETINDSSKSKLIVNHLKNIYNKLPTSNKNQFKNEVELLEMLYL